jgi:hypothetical protein
VRGVPAAARGSFTSRVIATPGNMKSAVTKNTTLHGRRSARISDSEPGTSPAMR